MEVGQKLATKPLCKINEASQQLCIHKSEFKSLRVFRREFSEGVDSSVFILKVMFHVSSKYIVVSR